MGNRSTKSTAAQSAGGSSANIRAAEASLAKTAFLDATADQPKKPFTAAQPSLESLAKPASPRREGREATARPFTGRELSDREQELRTFFVHHDLQRIGDAERLLRGQGASDLPWLAGTLRKQYGAAPTGWQPESVPAVAAPVAAPAAAPKLGDAPRRPPRLRECRRVAADCNRPERAYLLARLAPPPPRAITVKQMSGESLTVHLALTTGALVSDLLESISQALGSISVSDMSLFMPGVEEKLRAAHSLDACGLLPGSTVFLLVEQNGASKDEAYLMLENNEISMEK